MALNNREAALICLTRKALRKEKLSAELSFSESDWHRVLNLAEEHAVLSLLYDVVEEEELPESVRVRITTASRRIVQQSYRLLEITRQITAALAEEGIDSAILKGVAAAADYPVPELRKSGDVDLLLRDPEDLKRAQQKLSALSYVTKEEQHGAHHLAMINSIGIEIEVHTILAEPFEHKISDEFLLDTTKLAGAHFQKKTIMGYSLPVLSDGFHSFELLLHMLQHFLHSGFGLKLLCDWVCFWNREVADSEKQQYRQLVKQSGLEAFSNMVTAVCVRYLGLEESHALLITEPRRGKQAPAGFPVSEEESEIFLTDILEGGEFGTRQRGRMVLMSGTSFADYVKEFHYQMHQNFPRAGRIFLCWPVLWICTLSRFLKNNRRIRGVTTREILQRNRIRSRMINRLRLLD